MKPGSQRGLTMLEVLVVVMVLIMLTGLAVPAITATTCDDFKNVSIRNLQALHFAHTLYAADWNDRQFTLVRDDLSDFGSSPAAACAALEAAGDCHPPVVLGADCDGVERGFFFGCGQGNCNQFFVVPPINFPGGGFQAVGLGSFRIPNARGFHEYVNGRFFDPTFYAPKDKAVYAEVRPFFDVDCEFVAEGSDLAFSSSYALSPAAMYHPDVLSYNPLTGDYYRSPHDFPAGYESPTVSQATYPSQKSRMIEHHWLQNPPAPCNPAFIGCEPYFFNHGIFSVPIALFYDGHVNGLSVSEAINSERRHFCQTGLPLWSRDTPFLSNGYFIEDSFDYAKTSYHILTVDGIRGRDTLE